MSHKHFRRPANLPPVAGREDPPQAADAVARMKSYLFKVVAAAEKSLVENDGRISVREGLVAARALLSIIKHEQRLKERAEKPAAETAVAAAPTIAPQPVASAATSASPPPHRAHLPQVHAAAPPTVPAS